MMGRGSKNATFAAAAVAVAVMVMMLICGGVQEAVGQLAKVETFNPASCDGTPTNTFFVEGNDCQVFNDQGAVRISDVSASTRVSVHNQPRCEADTSVAQIFGPGCVVQGATKLRGVFIQG